MNEKIIQYIDKTNDENLVKNLKVRVNNWANNLPHHPYKNFGDKIEIKSLEYHPSYPIVLRSQHEKRTVHNKHIPHDGREIPPRDIFKAEDVMPWDRTLESIDDFVNDEHNFIASGSQHVEDCHTCNARGVITCTKCHGDRDITCPKCGGSGKNKCSSCGGSGNHQCMSCRGSGKIYTENRCSSCGGTGRINGGTTTCYNCGGSGRKKTTQNCSNCGGTGKRRCSNCGGTGKVRCNKCKGQGRITCPRCSGTGVNTCPTCEGHKQLMHYFSIKQEEKVKRNATTTASMVIVNDFPEFADNWQEYESKKVFQKRLPELTIEDLPHESHLKEFMEKLLANAQSDIEPSERILFQQMDIYKIDTWVMEYSYNGKDYAFVFHGSDYNLLPGKSPVSEYSDKMISKAAKSGKNRSFVKAYKLMKKSQDLDVYEHKEKVEHNLSLLRNRIGMFYHFGAKLGAILCALILGFMAYIYFSDVNLVLPFAKFINKPTNWFYGIHPWVMAITITWLIWRSGESVGKMVDKIFGVLPYGFLRFIIGFGVSLITSAMIFGLVVLLNFLSITIILTVIGWLIVLGIKIAMMIVSFCIYIVVWIFGKVF